MPENHQTAHFDPATAPKPNVPAAIKAKLIASIGGTPAEVAKIASTPPASTPNASIQAKLAENLATPNPAPAPKEPPVEETPAPQINVDPKSLKEITRLSKQNRELTTKVKEYETSVADATVLKEARALWDKDPKAAIAKLAATDPSGVIEKLLAEYHLADTDDAKAEVKEDLALRVKELEAKIDADQKARDADKATKDAESKKTEADKAIATVAEILTGLTENDKPKYPLCTKEVNQKEAILAAGQYAYALAKEKGLDPDTIEPGEVLNSLLADAFDIVESEYRELGQRFSLEESNIPSTNIETTPKEPETVNSKPTNRPAVSKLSKPPAKLVTKKPNMSVEESMKYYRDKVLSSMGKR